MKNVKILFAAGALALFTATGCSDDFLDLAPISQQNSTNFYKTSEDMKNALTAVYGSLQYGGQYYSSMSIIGELRSDNTEITNPAAGADQQAVDDFTNVPVTSISSNTWNAHYQGIQAANILLDRINNVTMDANLKARYIGEAKFLRALMYFNLVRIYGDVPLVVTAINDPQEGYSFGRESAEKVYELIISDLTEAENSLPASYSGADLGRATKGAAMALLGKVYLTQKNWGLAVEKLRQVIEGAGPYRLVDNYANIFGPANENNVESIFEVQFKGGLAGEGSPYSNQFAPIGSGKAVVSVGNPLGQNIPTDEFFQSYEEGDLRRTVSMDTSYVLNGNSVRHNYIKKYISTPVSNLDADVNWIVLRYADVLLMYAEALNEQGFVPNGPAFDYLNQIRKRAGLAEVTAVNENPALELDSQAAFRLAVEKERRMELAFEGHRWFDLVRTGRAIEVMAAKGMQPHQALFPIPQSQIDINPDLMTQNPGY